MPITLQRSSSEGSFMLWRKRTRSSNGNGNSNGKHRPLHYLPPSASNLPLPPTTTATASHPIPPSASPSPSTYSRTKKNRSTLHSMNSFAESTERLVHHGYNVSDENSEGRRRIPSFSTRRNSHQRHDYQYQYQEGIQPIPNQDEGIEAILPPVTLKKKPQPASQQELPTIDPPRRPKWMCFAPDSPEYPIPSNIVTTASSSSEQLEISQPYLRPTNVSTHFVSLGQEQDDGERWDYAFDADVWDTAAASMRYAKEQEPTKLHPDDNDDGDDDDDDVNQTNESLNTTFISNSSVSSTSSPHPDPAVAQAVVESNTSKATCSDRESAKQRSFDTKKKWKKRLFSWGKNRNKLKRSTSLESIGNASNGDSPSDKDFPNTKDWLEEADNNKRGIVKNNTVLAWEKPQVVERDQGELECEYRGNISVQDWFMSDGQEEDMNGATKKNYNMARKASFEHATRSTNNSTDEQGVCCETSNTSKNDKTIMGQEEDDVVDAGDLSKATVPETNTIELGQYAREMQSKPQKKKNYKPASARKSPTSSLLCAIPGLGKRYQDDDDDDYLCQGSFPYPECDGIPDYESDNNSYLAVSYSEEGVQLVMQQSDDIQHCPPLRNTAQPTDGLPKSGEAPPTPPSLERETAKISEPTMVCSRQASSNPLPKPHAGFRETGCRDEESNRFSQYTDMMSADLKFVAENLMRTYSFDASTKASTKLGASFGHPAAAVRESNASQVSGQRRLYNPGSFVNTTKEEDDASEKVFNAITQGLNTSTDSSLRSTTRVATPRNKGSPTYSNSSALSPIEAQESRAFEREVHNGITYHHYKPAAAQPVLQPPPRVMFSAKSSDKTSSTPDELSFLTPPPIRTMRANIMNSVNQEDTGGSKTNSDKANKIHEEDFWMFRRRDDPSDDSRSESTPTASESVLNEENKTQEKANRMYRYYCPAQTTFPYRASLSKTGAKYRELLESTTSKYQSSCETPMIPKIPAWKLPRPAAAWDESTAPTWTSSRSTSTLSYSELKYPQGRKGPFLGVAAKEVWDVYSPVQQIAKEMGATLCENVYNQPTTIPLDETTSDDDDESSRQPWAMVKKYGQTNRYKWGSPMHRYDDTCSPRNSSHDQLSQDDESSLHSQDMSKADRSKPDPPEEKDPRRQLV